MNKKGFSLIESLIAIGILGATSIFVAKIFQGSLQNAKLNRSRFEETELLNKIHTEFSRKEVCRQNLFPNETPTPMERPDIPQLLNAEGVPFLVKGEPYGDSGALIIKNISTSKITDSSLKLSVVLERNFKDAGIRSYERSLRFFVESDGVNIVGCFDIEDSVKTTITEITCLANADRGVYSAVVDSEGEITRCEKVGLDLSPCPDYQFISEIEAPQGEGVPYAGKCSTHMTGPSGDCSTVAGALISFDSSGNLLPCADPSVEQAIHAFSTVQQNCAGNSSQGFNANTADQLEVDCAGGGGGFGSGGSQR